MHKMASDLVMVIFQPLMVIFLGKNITDLFQIYRIVILCLNLMNNAEMIRILP